MDARFFGFSVAEALATDPQLRLLLEVSWEALEDASVRPDKLFGSVAGVFVGSMWNDYAELLWAKGGDSKRYAGVSDSISNLPGRLSYFYGFEGPSMQVDAACASSLVSVHLACQNLRSGSCDLALAAGVNVFYPARVYQYVALARFIADWPLFNI